MFYKIYDWYIRKQFGEMFNTVTRFNIICGNAKVGDALISSKVHFFLTF